jgi:hypothetical protein
MILISLLVIVVKAIKPRLHLCPVYIQICQHYGLVNQLIFEREVNLNADKKRFWLGEIESTDSRIMNESIPISMNYFVRFGSSPLWHDF